MKFMCENLMKEMMWAQAPTTLKFYTMKKEIEQENKSVAE